LSTSEIEKRITVLEDIEAIKQLKARYCAICDDDHNPDKIGSVFAEDGIWEGGDFGKAQGHQAIRKLFEGFKQLISFSQHNLMKSDHRGQRQSCERYLVPDGSFHVSREK
jgi:hypothetical protein